MEMLSSNSKKDNEVHCFKDLSSTFKMNVSACMSVHMCIPGAQPWNWSYKWL
jgi:hypothetical protein